MWTPPTTHELVGNGLGKNWSWGDQIQAARPFRITSSAIVAITTVRTLASLERPDHVRWISTPPTNAIPSVAKNAPQNETAVVADQRPGDVCREHRELALREVDHLGRLVDEDERECERSVDRAVGEARDQLSGRTAASEPEVRRAYGVVCLELGAARDCDRACLEHVGAAALQRDRRVLLDDEDSEALLRR